MRVAPVSVGLPYFNLRVANRLPFQIEHSSHDIEDETFSAPGSAGHLGQIGILAKRFQRIKGTEDLLVTKLLPPTSEMEPESKSVMFNIVLYAG